MKIALLGKNLKFSGSTGSIQVIRKRAGRPGYDQAEAGREVDIFDSEAAPR